MFVGPQNFRRVADRAIAIGEEARAFNKRPRELSSYSVEQIGEALDSILKSWPKADDSLQTDLDLFIEKRVIEVLQDECPGIGIVAEERHPTIPRNGMCGFVDPVDGTKEMYLGGRRWSTSIGVIDIDKGIPVFGFVAQPDLRRAFMGLSTRVFGREGGLWTYRYGKKNHRDRGWAPFRPGPITKSVLWTDFGPHSPAIYRDEVDAVMNSLRFQEIDDMPTVHAGIEMLIGNAACGWSHTTKWWDIAAHAVFFQLTNGVLESPYGGSLPWGHEEMGPVMLARTPDYARGMRKVLFDRNYAQRRLCC